MGPRGEVQRAQRLDSSSTGSTVLSHLSERDRALESSGVVGCAGWLLPATSSLSEMQIDLLGCGSNACADGYKALCFAAAHLMPPALAKGKSGQARESLIGLDIDELAQLGGSLHIDDEEIDAAFEFFDMDRQGKLTTANLKTRLGAFYKNLPAKEIKLLLGDGAFTKETLKSLLANNELGNYDPTREAFKAFDPQGTGFVDTDTMRSIFESLGYGDISDEDLSVLVETADVDRDGRISLEDFRGMMKFSKGGDAETAPPAAPPPPAEAEG